jgi:hypothetical protein
MKSIKLTDLLKESPLHNDPGERMEQDNTYMFFQNLKTIHHAIGHMLQMPSDKVSKALADGHGWALDHISTSADDVSEVYNFLQGIMSIHEFTITESERYGTLFKVKFKPEYTDSTNKPHPPVLVYLSNSDRTKIGQYAAVDNILGLGNTLISTLPTKDSLGSVKLDSVDLFKLVKSLSKTKFYR